MDVLNNRFYTPNSKNEFEIQVQTLFKKFLEDTNKATEALLLLNNDRNTLFIDFKEIEMFDNNLAEDIIVEYYRFYPYLCRAVALYVREEKMRQVEAASSEDGAINRELMRNELEQSHIKNKDYYVGFYNFAQRDNIRDLTSAKVGQLTRVTGQVIKTHSVHPELIIGCFRCENCLREQYVEQQFRLTQPKICVHEACANRTRYKLLLEKSRFTDFQRLRIQEVQQELPRGSIPRSFDVVVRGADQVECIQPGDQCDFIGTLIAIPEIGQIMDGTLGTVASEMGSESGLSGLKSLGVKEMNHTLGFLANACIIEGQLKPCVNTDKSYRESAYESVLNIDDFTPEEVMKIEKMSRDTHLLEHLSQSLFSSIYGSEDVKRGIILQLLGGVPKTTPTGTRLRGDINICLVGDPSTAKSQFLKIVTDFSPVKAVYASGKASSASGLTAAVVRDVDGGFVIEAGALMLADRGICCIDEFDKMDLKDQVAIHEAMEQQTISITKAGVSATLNARTSILAAANPIGGTYDSRKDLRSNLSFSLPIMSRFDMFFTIIDPHEPENDRKIATRILDMHINYANSKQSQVGMFYSFEDIRLYLRFARKYYPRIPPEVEKCFVDEYVKLRSSSLTNRTSWRITVRQLESLVRLSEAIARAYCKETVRPEYVEMAARLIEKTLVPVGDQEVDLKLKVNLEDEKPTQTVYEGELDSQPLKHSQSPAKDLDPSTKVQDKMKLCQYRSMAKAFIIGLRKDAYLEEKEGPGMKRSDLINWYLHQCVADVNTEAELISTKIRCEKVLDRLIQTDLLLMEVKEDGSVVDPKAPRVVELEEDRLIIINPTIDDDTLEQILA